MAIEKTFTLKSNNLQGQATINEIYNGYGGEGKNISPQLSWENAPEGTKSFAVTMFDTSAPSGSGWWHWVIFNIPASVNELVADAGNTAAGLAPAEATQSVNDYGEYGYGGPFPPEGHGPHQYIFTVFALSTDKLELTADTNPATVGFNLWGNTIAKASIVTYYER